MISASWPEPMCDVIAQMTALRDPDHPKDAVWLARGNIVPNSDGLIAVRSHAGTLLTTNAEKAKQFMALPSDDTLAMVLGYVEPKSLIVGEPIGVVAMDRNGAVIIDMASSVGLLERATDVASMYGKVRVMSFVGIMRRRIRLAGISDAAHALPIAFGTFERRMKMVDYARATE